VPNLNDFDIGSASLRAYLKEAISTVKNEKFTLPSLFPTADWEKLDDKYRIRNEELFNAAVYSNVFDGVVPTENTSRGNVVYKMLPEDKLNEEATKEKGGSVQTAVQVDSDDTFIEKGGEESAELIEFFTEALNRQKNSTFTVRDFFEQDVWRNLSDGRREFLEALFSRNVARGGYDGVVPTGMKNQRNAIYEKQMKLPDSMSPKLWPDLKRLVFLDFTGQVQGKGLTIRDVSRLHKVAYDKVVFCIEELVEAGYLIELEEGGEPARFELTHEGRKLLITSELI